MIAKRQVRRETAALQREQGKTRNVIVTVEPPTGLLGFRLKGLRRTEWLSADVVYEMAVKARVRSEAREKKQKRKFKR